ncbi:auxin-responsive protein IAA31-like isoform X2 [Phalaenopsis equestris]|uniref:auxin-responsive protein IAA31-like isoform X2 n=1 Tax=Phalaenopsis equestris TaxID=78828 RepID=UPI0009E35EED|nr:auxin-responsive protein IAA31-like isoform X2 [Phalaenopsis equestris]
METEAKSPSSSSDSSSTHPSAPPPSNNTEDYKITELSLALHISNPTSDLQQNNFRTQREQYPPANWPPIKNIMSAAVKQRKKLQKTPSFFIKVYMDGIPIGRKIDLYAVDGYNGLTEQISNMFAALILSSDLGGIVSEKSYVLTYEDHEEIS